MSETTIDKERSEWVALTIDRYQTHLIHYVTQFVGDLEEARDIVQDAFLELYGADRSKVEDHLGPWLFTVCRNRAVDQLRKEGRMDHLESNSARARAAPDSAPSTVVEHNDSYERVLRIVATLPPIQQEVVRLRFEAELTYREIGEVTGKSESNVGYLLHVALRTVRRRLREVDAAAARA